MWGILPELKVTISRSLIIKIKVNWLGFLKKIDIFNVVYSCYIAENVVGLVHWHCIMAVACLHLLGRLIKVSLVWTVLWKRFYFMLNVCLIFMFLYFIWAFVSVISTLVFSLLYRIFCHIHILFHSGFLDKQGWEDVFVLLPAYLFVCLQCFDTVGWAAGRASGLKNWVVGCWRGYLSGAMCRFAYGPADATATHCLLLQ